MVKGFTGKTLLIISQSAPLFPMTAEGAFPNQGPISKLGQAEGRTGGQLTNQRLGRGGSIWWPERHVGKPAVMPSVGRPTAGLCQLTRMKG